jgi:hypothetical protein
VADGTASSVGRVEAADRFGNAVDLPAPDVAAESGRIAPLERDAPGRYRTRYTAPRARGGGTDVVTARAGALEQAAPLRLVAPARTLAVTARGGLLHAVGGFSAPWLAAAAELWPHRAGGAYGLALELGHARTSRREVAEVGGGAHALEASAELWPLAATALARRRLAPRVSGLAGAGASLVTVRSTASFDGEETGDELGRALGVHLDLGVALELPSWHGRARLDARLGWQADPGMRSYRGSSTTVALTLGVSHDAL